MNVVIGIGGLIVVGISGYAFANFAEFEDLISQDVIIYSMCAGVILFLLSLIAIFGALNRMKKLLGVYIVLILIITVAEVIIVVVGLEYIGVISGASDADATGSQSLSNREAIVNDFLLRTYQTCCVLEENVCDVIQGDPEFCTQVQVCDNLPESDPNSATAVCVVGDDSIIEVDTSVCTAFEKFDSTLIDPPSQGGCGGGDPAQFLVDVVELIESEFTTLGAGFTTLIIIEFFLILFTTFIIFGKRVDYDRRMPWDETQEAVVVAEPVPRAELERMSQRSARPLSFTANGIQTGNRNRLSLDARRVSNQRRSNNRRSNNRRSAQMSNPVNSAATEGNPRPSSAEDPPPAAPQVEEAVRERVAKVPKPKTARSSIAREKIAADPEVINDIL